MGAVIQSYQDLDVWKKSRSFVKAVYIATEDFPQREVYGLTNQLRRAAVSIPSNIAEGRCRSSRKEFVYHLRIATGSVAEVETQIMIANDLGFLDDAACKALLGGAAEIGRMLHGLLRSLEPETRNLKPEHV